MKIGVMLRTIDRKRGVGIYTNNLMDHLLPLDEKNEYVLFYYNLESLGRYAQYEHVREKLVEAPISSLRFREFSFPDAASRFIWDQVKIPIEAKREGVDLLFNPADSVPLFAGCKTIMVLHGSEWYVNPRMHKLLDRIYIRIMMPLYCKKACLLISNSELSKRDFVNILRVSEEKIKTIYFGVDPRFRHIEDDDIFWKQAREKYHLPEKFILYVGRIYPGKNFGNLLHAFSRIHTSLPQKIVVAGHPRWDYQSVYASIEKLGLQQKVLFTGWVPQEDLVAFYNLADMFIFPSFYEAFGIPLLEAMACGCPAVASQTGALPEIAGGAAFFVNPYNPDEIAEAIQKVLTEDNLRKKLIEKGLQRAKAFSWEKCARETLAVFESLNGEMHRIGETGL
jgi:glycosyltransferase involved in cell wall biosynthesis